MPPGHSHFRDGGTESPAQGHKTWEAPAPPQASWAGLTVAHHFGHLHTRRPFSDQPLRPFRTGTLGPALTARAPGRAEPGTRGAHTRTFSWETNTNSLFGAPAHTLNRWERDTLGSRPALQASGTLCPARQSQDPQPAAQPGKGAAHTPPRP